MDEVLIVTAVRSTRLLFVLDWLFRERLGIGYSFATPGEQSASAPCLTIAYGQQMEGAVTVPAFGLLGERDISQQQGLTFKTEWEGLPVMMATEQPGYTLPFDLFSAIFYHLSRYEEYLPYQPDAHQRYPYTSSILHQNQLLQRPIVDEWVHQFAQLLTGVYGVVLHRPAFSFTPTYDIDIAYSHSYKGVKRIAGAYLRALLKGDLGQIAERTQVLKKKQKDPYDSFAWIRQQHDWHGYTPIYFVLCALKTTPFDKNIHPRHPAMVRVIRQLTKEGYIGIHPSYFATSREAAMEELAVLEEIAVKKIAISRQHYIKLQLPSTCKTLLDCGITDDYSMGYGATPGFRAGTGASFLWYDLQNEAVTSLRMHPFCFMDSSAHYDQHMTAEAAFELLGGMADRVRASQSNLITVFHNFSLGTAKEWAGWREAYEVFLSAQTKA